MVHTYPKLSRLACLWVILASALLMLAASARAAEIPDKFKPVEIASGVKGEPGTAAWSSDGRHLAYIADKVMIYDTENGKRSTLKLKGPYFISWADEGHLVVLHGEGQLSLVETAATKIKSFSVPRGTVAAYPSWDGRRLLVFTATSTAISIGVEVAYGLAILDPADGTLTEVFSTSRILPRRYAGTEQLKGWMNGGPSPISGEAMLLEFIVPPNAPPYIRVLMIDPFTRTSREALDRYRDGLLKAWGAWSPSGERAALVDDRGNLTILSLGSEPLETYNETDGLYPAWDPIGGRIFFGGYLMTGDGSDRTPILPKEPGSTAFFSPDGIRMALAAGGKLWLLNDIGPSKSGTEISIGEPRRKASMLRDLYSGGFLTAEEYRERLYAIIERQENTE